MRKNLLLSFVVMFGVTLQSMAQLAFEDVKTPPFRKYIRVKSGVNLREKPTTQSPRLVEHFDGFCSLEWSSKSSDPNEKPCRAEVLPVWESSFNPGIKESKDWLCGQYRGKQVYVMRNFCEEVALRPLSLPAPKSVFLDLVMIESGKYKDCCIALCETDPLWDGGVHMEYIRLGKYKNGMFIFDYFKIVAPGDSNKIEDKVFNYSPVLSSNDTLDLQKLVKDTQLMKALMEQVYPVSCWEHITYFGVEGDSNWYSIENVN